MKDIDIKCLGEQLTFSEGNSVYYMELAARKNKRIFLVEISDEAKQLRIMDNEFIFDLTQLVKKKILSELKKGKKIKEIIEIGIKLEADALINKAS